MKTRMATAHMLAGFLTVAISTTALPAHADGARAADVHLTPPDPAPTSGSALPESAPVPQEPVEYLPTRHPAKIAALIFGGVAIVGVGIGTAFGALALQNQTSFNAHPTVGTARSGNQEAIVADVAFGAAVIAGATSVVLFLNDRSTSDAADAPDPASQPAASKPVAGIRFAVSPIVNPHGGGAGVVLRF